MANEENKVSPKELTKAAKSAAANGPAKAPAGLFTKAPAAEVSANPVRVQIIKSQIDNYAIEGGSNQPVEIARQSYKSFVNAIEQIQTLGGADLRECLAYIIKAIAEDTHGAFTREAAFRFLPEINKAGVLERTSRFLNMAIIYASSSKEHFKNMVDVEYSVNRVQNDTTRDQIASYFNA